MVPKYVRPAKRARSSSGMPGARRKFRRSVIPRPVATVTGTAFPLRLQNTLRYTDSVELTLNANGYGQYLFSCNGLYDPDITGVGHQPLYFDQLTALYNHYKVVRSTMVVQPMVNSDAIGVTTPSSYVLNLYTDDDTTLASGGDERWDARGTVVTQLATQASKHRISWKGDQVFGGNVIDNPDLQGNATNNPAEQTYYIINIESGVGGMALKFRVEIFYTVIWDELKSVVRS